MKIWFAKGKQGAGNVLTCFRDDGTATWTPLGDFFPYHDLTHYAVETTLGCRDAFLGLIAQGWGIPDFTEKQRDPVTGGGVKSVFPSEALDVEVIVGTLDRLRVYPEVQGDAAATESLFFDMLGVSIATEVTPEQFRTIYAKSQALIEQWLELESGTRLELEF